MSQAAAKASRRAIRKAVGPEAIDVINSHAASITDILHALETFNARLTKLAETVDDTEIRHASEQRRRERSILSRLKWLVFGR